MGSYTVLALLLLFCVNIAILVWGIGLVYPNMDHAVWLFVITPFVVDVVELGGWLFFGYFLFLVAAIVLSFLWLVKKSVPTFGKELLLRPVTQRSPLYLIGTVFLAIFFFQVAYYIILAALGIQSTTPAFGEQELWTLIFSFAQASVYEELVTRVLLLGIPLLIFTPLLASLLKNSKSGKTMERRKWWRYILGGGFKIGKLEVFFLVFSSAMFGFAHLASWDLFKVFPAAIAGLAMGYLFLKEGLYAAVMLHFFFDYLSMPLQVFPSNLTLELVIGLMVLVFSAVGAVYFIYYTARAIGFAIGVRFWPDKPFAGKPQPAYATTYYASYPSPPQGGQYSQPPYGPAPQSQPTNAPPPQRPIDPTAFGFVCRGCGNTEATYKDGQLICSRCGIRN